MSPELKRREYPEVSYAMLETLALGVMGIQPEAAIRTVTTTACLTSATGWVELKDLPMFDGTITVRHTVVSGSVLANHTKADLHWQIRGKDGKVQSLVVRPGERKTASWGEDR